MSKAVVCRSIEGYENYEPLPDAAQTSDEKLLVYFRPLGYRISKQGDKFLAHLTQDGRVRRKGTKAVLRQKLKLLDYRAESPHPPVQIYLRNSVSLKGLPPGDYEFDIILRDENQQGEDASVTQSVEFRIIPAQAPTPKSGESAEGSEPDRF